MNSHDGIGQLVDVWLPKAERWIEAERDKTIEALTLCFQSDTIDADTAWGDLPSFYRKRFKRIEASMNRVDDGRVLQTATDGDLTSWRPLFAACGKITRRFTKLAREAEAFNDIGDFEWWVLLNFTYLQCGVLDCGVGGKRQNLDPAFKMSVNGMDLKDSRFYVDDKQAPAEFSESLKRSAIEYGYFATISDLRLSTIASIRWMNDTAARLQTGNKPSPKRSGPYLLSPQTQPWPEVALTAQKLFEFETKQSSVSLTGCLLTMARLWFEIVSFNHKTDHYTKFAQNIESLWLYFFESRRQWEHCRMNWKKIDGFEFLKIPCDSTADGTIEFFDIVVNDVLEGVRGERRLANDTLIDQAWAADFHERLSARLNRLGIEGKPMDALNLLRRLERDLPIEAEQASLSGEKSSTLATPITITDALIASFKSQIANFENCQWSKMARQIKDKAKNGRGRHYQSFYIEDVGGIYYSDDGPVVFRKGTRRFECLATTHSDKIGKKIAKDFGLKR